MKVLVCGDRNWRDEDTIALRLSRLPKDAVIIHGDNGNEERTLGADRIADRVAEDMGLARDPHPAEWDKYGRAAGPIRNSKMLELRPDLVLAFHGFLERSRGTKDTVGKARALGIAVEVIAPRRKRDRDPEAGVLGSAAWAESPDNRQHDPRVGPWLGGDSC